MVTYSTYTKLGRSSQSGQLHAVRGETMSDWDGPKAFCGEVLGMTIPRTATDRVACSSCRTALGLGERQRVSTGLSFSRRSGRR